jgi:hypothetical protein
MRTLVLAVIVAVAGLGCTEPRSTACKEVCKREAECIDATTTPAVELTAPPTKVPFDEKECIAACAALEHDVEHSAAKVARHIDCVNQQQTCPAVLECK